MMKQFIFSFFLTAIGVVFFGQDVLAQSDCDKGLITAENLYQSGQLYDIPQNLIPCLENGFNYQEKQSAYRLLTLTYLNINQEEKAKSTLHKLLKLNPDYVITKEKDPVELYNLYLQFKVDPVFYSGIRGGMLITRPLSLLHRSSSSLEGQFADKSYTPSYGFTIGGDFALPLLKHLLLEFSPSFARSNYKFQLLYLTDAFSETAGGGLVQEVNGRENYNSIILPLTLNLRLYRAGGKLMYNIGAGGGASFLLASSYNDVNRVNKQIFTEEINVNNIKTTPYRRNVNVSGHLEVGVEYKYSGYFIGGRAGLSSTFFNYTQYPNQQEMFLNRMSTNFGWLDDDFILMNGYFSFFIRKPIYKFL